MFAMAPLLPLNPGKTSRKGGHIAAAEPFLGRRLGACGTSGRRFAALFVAPLSVGCMTAADRGEGRAVRDKNKRRPARPKPAVLSVALGGCVSYGVTLG